MKKQKVTAKYEKQLTAKYEKKLTAKCQKYVSDKTQQRKVRKRTNVGASKGGKVETAEGSTDARTKDDNGCTEVRNREEVPALMQDEKY